MTGYLDGQSLSSHYVLDGNDPLAATAGGQTTYYLPHLGEKQQGWSYYLPDGTGTVRQMADEQGDITVSRSLTPWGELLSQSGSGAIPTSYLGGMLDAATGLIYVGNGQYYDPATGRFLTRNVYPGASNPYVPWHGDPLGLIVAPLGLWALIRGRRKGGKLDQFVVVLVFLAAAGLTLSSCTPAPNPIPPTTTPAPSTPAPTQTPSPDPSPKPNGPSTPTGTLQSPTYSPSTPTSCTPTSTETSTSTITPTLELPEGDILEKAYKVLATATNNPWWRMTDTSDKRSFHEVGVKDVIAVIAYLELNQGKDMFTGAKDAFTWALGRQYWYKCPGGCTIKNGKLDENMKQFLYGFSTYIDLASQMNGALTNETYGKPDGFYEIAEEVISGSDSDWKEYNIDEPFHWGNALSDKSPDWLVRWIKDHGYRGAYHRECNNVFYAWDNWYILTPKQEKNLCHNSTQQMISCLDTKNLEKPDWITALGY